MKTFEDAKKLALTMCEIGNALNRDTRAVLTDMSQPLGLAIGNALEVKEAIDTLNGHGPKDFEDLCLQSAAIMLEQAKIVKNEEEGRQKLIEVIHNGKALEKLCEMIKYQGGDESYILHPERFELAKHIIPIISNKDGYIKQIVALKIGESSMKLGGGRETFEDVIDMAAGIVLNKKVGDKVNVGDILCYAHTNKENVDDILNEIHEAFEIVDEVVSKPNSIHLYVK